MDYTYLYLIIPFLEFVTFIIATVNYSKFKNTTEKYFLPFLFYTLLTEAVGYYVGYILKEFNLWVFIIFVFVSFLFYLFWFQLIIKSKTQRRIIKMLILVFAVVGIYNFIFLSLDKHHLSTFVVGALSTIVASIFFYTQLLDDKKEVNVQLNLKFWITTGLLLFNVGMVPFMIFSEEFSARNDVRFLILLTLNLIFYSCYSIGFILRREQTEK